MPLTAGTRLGPYEILAPIGAGGMGEVYKARDTRLDRIVAIKILPPHIAARPQARERFEREARTVSSLNHPHICSLFDVGCQDDTDFLVMEYLEGESLSDRLLRGALPIAQTLDYARQIADALDAAHRQGVVHRDLKPGNIMLTKSGAKLLDFGLAKMRTSAVGDETLTEALTSEGTLLGTLQYMAPEQLEGKEVDPRADIFAFGEVLYEMATGRKAFTGRSQASLIANIMHVDPPPVSTLQPAAPPVLDRVIERCLAKDPDQRWQNVRDPIFSLEWEADQLPDVRRSHSLAWTIAGVVVTAMLALAVLYFRQPAADTAVTRFTVSAPEKTRFHPISPFALSPDGRQLAFVAMGVDGKSLLWVRPLDSLTARVLPGTEEARAPFWSPDSRHLGFFAQNKIKRIDLSGGTPQTLCDAASALSFSGAWNRDGVILFSGGGGEGLRRVPAAGGAPIPATKLDKSRDEIVHYSPHFLPDGRHFLYSIVPSSVGGIGLGSLDSEESKRVLDAKSNALYVPPQSSGPGYLLYGRGETLLAQPFNAKRLQTTGDPIPVAENVQSSGGLRFRFSTSENGVLAYQSGNVSSRQLTWLDRESNKLEPVGAPSVCFAHQLSPDGKHILMEILDSETSTGRIWLFDLLRGSLSLLSSSPKPSSNWDFTPLWSPDGSRIAFVRFTMSSSHRSYEIYQKLSNGAGNDELLLKLPVKGPAPFIDDWSRDGVFLLYDTPGEGEGRDLMTLPLSGERRPAAYLTGSVTRRNAQFSPDRRWVAYVSNESGTDEVYVQNFPTPTAKWHISLGGGTYPRWRRDGKELFYLSPGGKIMSVAVKAEGAFEAGAPKALLDIGELGQQGVTRNPYDVTADGRRFLVNRAAGESVATPITVVLNWTSGLRK